jgi:hypothetical protein
MVGVETEADQRDIGAFSCGHRADFRDLDLASDHLVAETCYDPGKQLQSIPPLVRDQDTKVRVPVLDHLQTQI